MRGKIIAVFAVVVLVVGGLSYALTRATLGDGSSLPFDDAVFPFIAGSACGP